MPTETQTTAPDTAAERQAAISTALADIRALTATGVDRATLATVAQRLCVLAEQKRLFSRADFPPPAADQGVGASTRYRLNADDGDDGVALYLNAINPGKRSIPHNHDTWAVIAAVEGEEENRLWRRTDDGSDPARATLELDREVTVKPGTPITFMPQDLHSIHTAGSGPTLHFHLYGQALETLTGRIGVELETGAVVNYNKAAFTPSTVAA